MILVFVTNVMALVFSSVEVAMVQVDEKETIKICFKKRDVRC